MGMSKMLEDTRFCFNLEKMGENKTRVVNKTYYQPTNLIAKLMNVLLMKKMISQAQEQILSNIKALTENNVSNDKTCQ
jgi:hypothetical protein